MDTLTRREAISSIILTSGAFATGCLSGCSNSLRNPKMAYRPLGRTGLDVSVIGFGAEWMERNTQEICTAVTRRCEEHGVNIVDCWMSNPEVRTKLGNALRPNRKHWIIQGHIGSTWKNGQYERTRDLPRCKEAFEDLLKIQSSTAARRRTDHSGRIEARRNRYLSSAFSSVSKFSFSFTTANSTLQRI